MARNLGVPVTTEGNYCFISYNSEDCEVVGEIVRGLHQAGVPLWYDDGIHLSDNFHEVIAERIDNCSCILIFFTKNILNKGKDSYVYIEYELAKDFSRKPVYVIMMDEINKKNVPYAIRKWYADLCRLQNINSFECSLEQTVQKICEAVSEDMNLDPENSHKTKNRLDNISIEPYEGDEPYVFVSYCHSDLGKAQPIIRLLIEKGINVWFDKGINPGNEWPDEIQTHLEHCSVFLPLISDAYCHSLNCRNELSFAIGDHIETVPVFIAESKLENGVKVQIASFHHINQYMIENHDEFLALLLKANGMRFFADKPEPFVKRSSAAPITEVISHPKVLSLTKLHCFTSNAHGESAYDIETTQESVKINIDYMSADSPDYGGVYLRFGQGLDLHLYKTIKFDMQCSGLKRVRFECKPYSGNQMHESFLIKPDEDIMQVKISTEDFEDSRNLLVGELTWAVYRIDFSDEKELKAMMTISNLTVD